MSIILLEQIERNTQRKQKIQRVTVIWTGNSEWLQAQTKQKTRISTISSLLKTKLKQKLICSKVLLFV